MKIKKLGIHGFSHDLLVGTFVVVFAIAGIGFLVAGHANNVAPGGTYAFLGQVALPQQNETVKAYGCKFSVASNVWQVNGFFSLSNSYKVPNTWQAFITNTGKTPYPGHQTANGYFSDTASPTVLLTTDVYNNVNNYLQFTYSAGPSIKGQTNVTGTIAANIRAGNLPTCTK